MEVVTSDVAAYAAGLRMAMKAPWSVVNVVIRRVFGARFRDEDLQAAAQAWAERTLPRDSIAWTDADYGPDAVKDVVG